MFFSFVNIASVWIRLFHMIADARYYTTNKKLTALADVPMTRGVLIDESKKIYI